MESIDNKLNLLNKDSEEIKRFLSENESRLLDGLNKFLL
jgi:hypothetical protein